jgi:SsrA-binding protein
MAAKKPSSDAPGVKVVASNRRARRDYEILETLECGISLRGSEVKALREAKVTLADTYATVRDSELWLIGMHLNPYSHAGGMDQPDPDRDRKLLAHRGEIERWAARLDQQPLTIVPLRLYFKDGRAKVELGLARGRKQYDKRQDLARREAECEAARAMSRAVRRRTH